MCDGSRTEGASPGEEKMQKTLYTLDLYGRLMQKEAIEITKIKPPQWQLLEEQMHSMQNDRNCFTVVQHLKLVVEHMLYERMDNNLRVHSHSRAKSYSIRMNNY